MAVVLQGSQKKDGIAAANSVQILCPGLSNFVLCHGQKKELQEPAPAECS